MDKKTVFVKTSTGESEVNGESDALYGDAKRILHLVDDESNVGDITKRAPPSLRETINDVLQELLDGGYIRDMRAPAKEPQKPALKMASPAFKMASPKAAPPAAAPAPSQAKVSSNKAPTAMSMPDMSSVAMPRPEDNSEQSKKSDNNGDLDFSFISSAASPAKTESSAAQDKAKAAAAIEAAAKARQDAERLKAEQLAQAEVASKAAKLKAYEDAKIKAQIEVAARAKIEAAAREKQEADQARLKAEQAALKARTESEMAKARIEAEVRARIEAETRVKQEAEAVRIKAEKEAEKLRQELAAAKIKAETEMRNRLEAEARAKAEAEARRQREAEAERLRLEKERAELEVARVKVDAELRMRADAETRVRAEVEARLRDEEMARHGDGRSHQADTTAGVDSVAGREQQVDQAEKLRQSFVESFVQNKKNQGAITGSFKLEKFSMVDTGKIAAYSEQAAKPAALPGSGSKVKAAIEERARKEAEAKRIMAEQEQAQASGAQNEAARIKALQDEAAARAKAEQESVRLKAEHEAYRLKLAQEEERAKAAAEAQKLTDSQTKQWEEAQRRAAIQAQAEKDRLAKQEAEAQIKSRQKSNRAPRKSLPVGKIFAGLMVLALLAVAGLPYVWPVDEYIAPLEAEMSAQIRQPVHIRKIQFALLPLPRIELHTVAIGKADELKIGDVTMNFDISALFAPTKSISKLELKNVTVSGASLDNVLLWLQAAGGIEAYPVAQIELKGVRISGDEVKIPLLNGKADFSPQGKFTHASLKSEDSKWGLELQMEQNSLLLEFNLQDSGLPVFPGIKFNDVSSKVILTNGEAVFTDFFAHIHGGTLTGKGRLNWNNGWKLQGQVNAKSLELHRMFPGSVLSGEVFGEMNISMASPSLLQLDKDARFEGSFESKNGVISKLDIETIARFGARPGVAGRTNFTELSGTIKGSNSGQQIYLGKLSTAAVNSTGLIDVDANQQLSGKLQVDIKSLGMTGVPLRLSGTTTEPILQPGR